MSTTHPVARTTPQSLRRLIEDHRDTDLPPLTDQLVATLDLPAGVPQSCTIAEVSQLTGVSTDTLRYYEKAGLVHVDRAGNGHRSYDTEALGRVVFLTRLRMADMPIREIQRYLALVDQGEQTVGERLELLQRHRAEVERRKSDLEWALAVIDYKITTYGGECGPSSAAAPEEQK